MNNNIQEYNKSQNDSDREICELLAIEIDKHLPEAESKVWHAHPVWFINGNPIVGYSKLKAGVQLLFWSGVSFEDDKLTPGSGKFKDASILYTSLDQINIEDLITWLNKARDIQWDYKNIYKKKGILERINYSDN